jgi:hypothetical protein
MLIGINYPWINYGWDFGDPPAAWVTNDNLPAWRATKRKQIEQDFRLFASQGIFAVRWFLLADGLNCGTGSYAPRRTRKNWTFDLLPDGHSYYHQLCDDFVFVLHECRNSGLQLLPSLVDFHWCDQGMPVAGNMGIIKGGRHDVIRDPTKRRVFFDRILDPLLASSMKYPNSIYAWELINEPEWAVQKLPVLANNHANPNLSRETMKIFIAEGIRRINGKRLSDGRHAFQSTVGFAHWDSLNRWDAEKLGITLHQFHYYAQRHRRLPRYSRVKGHPCVIGEFATAAARDWPDLKLFEKDQTITNRLSCIEGKGYPACFMWSARAMDPATRWAEDAHREIVEYHDSKRVEGIES